MQNISACKPTVLAGIVVCGVLSLPFAIRGEITTSTLFQPPAFNEAVP
jgi:hypothetical protein